jgi:hypothetical protein
MHVTLSRTQATIVRLEHNSELIRACFYLGYSYLRIEELILNETVATRRERKLTIETARALGMSETDTIAIL